MGRDAEGSGGRSGDALDVAIVGGGVAGAYVAHRLAERRPGRAIALFERTDRIGGRLLSLRMPGVEGVRAELGGMRYRTSQPMVAGIIEELDLPSRPFLTAHEDNRYLLRGARWRAVQAEHAATAYGLEPRERVSPGELLLLALERIVPGGSSLTQDEWVEVKRDRIFRGRPLRDWSMGDALAEVLSEEGARYLVDGFGYADLLADRSAADAVPWALIETRPESENRTLVDGMERLPRELAARFVARGGLVRLRHELIGLREEKGALRLHFKGRPDVVARRVVVALPRRGLERIAERSPLLGSPGLRSLFGSVTALAAAKLFLAYDRPWWRGVGFRGRRAVSDLLLSKTYYFDRDDVPGVERPSLLLASYSDGPAREAWSALLDRSAVPPDHGAFDAEDRWERYSAGPRQVAAAQRHLRALHETDEVPDPVASAFMDWGADPFGGAWHVWNAGARSWRVMEEIVRPLPDRELYICGEAYSWSQGWVEGALEAAERVVTLLT